MERGQQKGGTSAPVPPRCLAATQIPHYVSCIRFVVLLLRSKVSSRVRPGASFFRESMHDKLWQTKLEQRHSEEHYAEARVR